MNLEGRRLVVVSNAEPFTHRREGEEIVCEKQAGGLTSAINPVMENTDGLWIAWGRGDEVDFDVLNSESKVKVPDEDGYTLKRIKLSRKEVDEFYLGFSNSILWPISHSFLEKSILKDYSSAKSYWETYYEVNKKYAEAVIDEYQENDLIWVHDYHLILVPKMIREELPEADIAYFWHIPWPPWEIFGAIPWGEEIMDGLLGTDFVGFHANRYLDNFLSCAEMMGKKVDKKRPRIREGSRVTRASTVPIGIDYDLYSSIPKKEKAKEKAQYLKDEIEAEKIIVSVDRLDYTKGIPQRLKAFELFLEEYPEFQGKVTLVQRIPPSRRSVEEYQTIRNRINRILGRINGEYSKADWTPVKSFHRFLPDLEELVPYYSIADVGLVTPLNDGMNLVCKEYVAASDDGVLVLSDFAGAAEELREALHVNPYDTQEVADGIKEAVCMKEDERRDRLQKLKKRVKEKDLDWWRKEFMRKWVE